MTEASSVNISSAYERIRNTVEKNVYSHFCFSDVYAFENWTQAEPPGNRPGKNFRDVKSKDVNSVHQLAQSVNGIINDAHMPKKLSFWLHPNVGCLQFV